MPAEVHLGQEREKVKIGVGAGKLAESDLRSEASLLRGEVEPTR